MSAKNFDIEKGLETLYGAPAPSEEFLLKLEANIRREAQKLETAATQPIWQKLFAPGGLRLGFVTALAVMIMAAGVALAGPQNIASALEQLMGYIPGFGYTEIREIRVLPEPVSQTKGEVTVTVKQVLASEEGTYVVIRASGLPSEQEIFESLLPVTPENFHEWQNRYLDLYETDARLVLPDGQVFEDYEGSYQGAAWDGTFTFPVLPEEATELSFTITRLAGVPEGRAPEGWQFDLRLEAVDEAQALALPTPQAVRAEGNTQAGFSANVLDAVYAGTETALRVQVNPLPAGWKLSSHVLGGTLRDDRGIEYGIIYGPNSGLGLDGLYTLTFQPLAPDAESLTLEIPAIEFEVPISEQVLQLDLGAAPRIGDRIVIDQTIEVQGVPVHFLSATIREDVVPSLDGSPNPQQLTILAFEIAPLPLDSDILISGILPDTTALGQLSTMMMGLDPADEESDTYTLRLSIGIPADQLLPTGTIQLVIEKAFVSVGPFTSTWTVEK